MTKSTLKTSKSINTIFVEVAENEGFMDDDEDIVNYAKNHDN